MRRIKMGLKGLTVSLLLFLVGCDGGPMGMIPGGELSGTVVNESIEDWSFVDADHVDLETNGDSRRSVRMYYELRDGKLYLEAEEGKTWFTELKKNPAVRIRLGDNIYPVTAVLAGEPGELSGFNPDEYIFRLDSRPHG